MEYRRLGGSGFSVPALSFGAGAFGGEFFAAWGATDVKEASRLIDICLEAGLTLFDSADIYSSGRLDAASQRPATYPYWHQYGFAERNPPPV